MFELKTGIHVIISGKPGKARKSAIKGVLLAMLWDFRVVDV